MKVYHIITNITQRYHTSAGYKADETENRILSQVQDIRDHNKPQISGTGVSIKAYSTNHAEEGKRNWEIEAAELTIPELVKIFMARWVNPEKVLL
ncbi:hypothetical protein CHS0354_029237 [Potamilus streckersoni]|uniref:Uncharacterized protein n=1 Tax=Potamilus streckersoni TaxID=2493646 RepID=A0AAE0RUK4_9BIVA|nr:hypothetical protein CHS0354_029237 [Potamilus streckersoni]